MRDIFLRYFVAKQPRLFISFRFRDELGQLPFDFGDPAVLHFARLPELSASLRLLELGAQILQLFFQFALLFKDSLFLLPLGFQSGRSLFQRRQFFLQFFEPLLAGWILFLFQRLPLHFMLHDVALNDVDLRRHRFEFDF